MSVSVCNVCVCLMSRCLRGHAFGHDKTNLGDIVQDDDMHMVGIVVDSDDNCFFAAFDVISYVDIGNNIATDIVVMVPSYSARSVAI